MAKSAFSSQCTATSKRSGKRCRQRVIGGGICHMHGRNAASNAQRLARVALAEELASSPNLHPGDVLISAVRRAEMLVRHAERELAAQGVTPRTMKALRESILTAGALSRSALSAEAEDRAARFSERQTNALDRVLRKFLKRLRLDDDPDAHAAMAAALASVTADGDEILTGVASIWFRTKESAEFMAGVVEAVFAALGLNSRDPWVGEQVSAAMRAFGQGRPMAITRPTRDWWEMLLRRSARELGLPDPVPTVEILPARPRRELTR